MYRALSCIPVIAICFLLVGCSSCSSDKKKDRKTELEGYNPLVEQLDETPDSAFLARLVDYTDDSVYVTSRYSSRRMAYAYADAKAVGKVQGTLEKGNWFSLFPDNRQKLVLAMINTTELSGKWEYDQKQHRGLSFNERGGMSSINPDKVCFREWKLLNGLLYIYYVDMQQKAGDRHQYRVEEANIANLSKDCVTLQVMGRTFECTRPSDKPLRFE